MSDLSSLLPFSAAIASALGVLAGAAFSLFARKGYRIAAINEQEDHRDYDAEVRLRQIQAILRNEVERRSALRKATALLVFSQFIVGGVLASSFVVKALGETMVGILGLLVLASSLTNQHFRPDVLHKIANEKVRRLKALRRKIEDDLYIATRGEVSDAKIIEIRLYASKALEEIESAEHQATKSEEN